MLIFGAAFVAEIRAAIVAAFPGQAPTILGGTLALRPGSATRIGSTAILVTVVLALFFHTVHLGYDVREDEIGTFRSRYTRLQLESAAKDPVLKPGSDGNRAGLGWPAEQRAHARVAAGDHRPFVSDAAAVPIYDWPKSMFWLMIALATGAILVIAISASKKERPGP